MRPGSIALALLAASLPNAAARAADTVSFETFRRFCIDTDATAKDALAQADADGWGKLSKAAALRLGLPATVEGREGPGPKGQGVLIVGNEPDVIGGKPVITTACAIVIQGPAPAGFKADAQNFASAAPGNGPAGAMMWILAKDERGRAISPHPWDAESLAAVRAGRLRMMMFQADGERTMIGYSVPRFQGPN